MIEGDVTGDRLERPSFGSEAFRAATFLSRGALWGLVCGAAIGGVGGRIAMLVLRLTSPDSVIGVKSDDDFVIGRFSTETLFLVAIAAALGVVGGLVYLLAREWLPRRGRPALFGLLCAVVMGAAVISPDGVDFTRLRPHSLAVALFVLIPAAYGVTAAVLIERSLRLGRARQGVWRWVGLVPLLAFALSGPLFLVALAVFTGVVLADRSGRVTSVWRSVPARWLGRGAVSAVFVATGMALVNDVAEIL